MEVRSSAPQWSVTPVLIQIYPAAADFDRIIVYGNIYDG
jgi:hypothetical protein